MTGREDSAAPARSFLARHPILWPALAVLLLTSIAYWPAFSGGYVWDDDIQIVKNPGVRADDGLLRIWWNRHSTDYLPLTYSMHWLEWRLFNASPMGPHVINVLLHAAGAVLLGLVLRRLRVPGAWLAALFFAVHPVAVASAAWLAERKNTLSMVLYLASILAYLRFEDSTRVDEPQKLPMGNCQLGVGNYVLSLGLFLLALLAKTSVVMLPLVLLLLAWWRRGKVTRQDGARMVPFFALSLAAGVVTVWFQWHGHAHGEVRPEGAASRIAAAGWIAWFYLFKLLLPVKLCAVYARWDVDGSRLLSFVPLALLAAATAALWSRRKRWGAGPLAAWACFLISLLPVLGFVDMAFMKWSLVADHLQYAAMPPILALAAALLARATSGAGAGRAAAVVAAAGGLAAMAALTFQHSADYRDALTLWSQSVRCNPRSALAYLNLGGANLLAGAPDEAIRDFDKSLELDSRDLRPWCGRANAQLAAGRCGQAIRDAGRAIALDPAFAEGWFSRGVAYARAGRPEEALRDLSRAIELKPDDADSYYNRGNLYLDAQRCAEAIRDFGQAIALRPDYADAWYNRGNAYAACGRPAEAIRDYSRAIELRPDDPDAWYNRAVVRRRLKQESEALADFQMARKLGWKAPGELPGPSGQPPR